ncbi:YunC family protein [Bacillus paralicheniformis]|nr:YunC family protein [Bacillus paralicheniformis]UWS62524.1 YunC family protein [Bacillus paralicheniformis]
MSWEDKSKFGRRGASSTCRMAEPFWRERSKKGSHILMDAVRVAVAPASPDRGIHAGMTGREALARMV